MSHPPQMSDESKFWLLWVLANTFGTAIGWYVGASVGKEIKPYGPQTVSTVVHNIILGATIGLVQWLVLRKRIRDVLWIVVSALGWTIGWPISFAVLFTSLSFVPALPVALAVGGAVLGVFIGLAQWFILNKQVPSAGWWIPLNIVGSAAGYAVGAMGVFRPVGVTEPRDIVAALGMAAYGVIYGFITGAVLFRLLQQSRGTRQY